VIFFFFSFSFTVFYNQRPDVTQGSEREEPEGLGGLRDKRSSELYCVEIKEFKEYTP
jgi:hypothetical protein